MSNLAIDMLEDLWKRYYVPPSKQIKAIYVWEGPHDPANPLHWRNRPGWKSFVQKSEMSETNGYLVPKGDIGILSGIPLIVSPFMLPGKILMQMMDGSMQACNENEDMTGGTY